ncbi:transcription elongation factor GreB [Sinobacterium caligoides]|uniref:Transcription elongation factor GreB n=1 Tax=Sinobacterium caligoides TaxID=933926 RepID=A0A3N2DNH3_9GAMM|nr:transcription elongation factor GreB [Sinobacterium caligoides]ROS01361.1 transcription elongation factor GreB [Sinobacterium caligoides]
MGRYRPPRRWGSNYISKFGEKVLKDELHQLWKIERPLVTQAVHEAALNGDRSENGDYIYGKKRLREIDSRVRYLTKRLEAVTVVSQPPSNQEKIYFGATVTIENEEGETQRYTIVGPDEFDLKSNKLSMDAPVAKAMFGKQVDDEFAVHTPNGEQLYYVITISYHFLEQPME